MATWKETMEFEGTETEPFILDEPFSIECLDNKTPFGIRYGFGDTITLKSEHLEALMNGKYIAVDVECEYVIFLKLDIESDVNNGYLDSNEEHYTRTIRERVDSLIMNIDVCEMSIAIDEMADTLIDLHNETIRLKRLQHYHMAKADKWEERARALYRELHGKDAPPQG